MWEWNLDRSLAVFGIFLATVLLVLDKANKLKGPILLILLAFAFGLMVPVLYTLPWVAHASSGSQLWSRRLLLTFIAAVGWGLLAVWVTSGDAIDSKITEQSSESKALIQSQEPLSSIENPIQDMQQIELVEHGEFSKELILECINRGAPVSLSASIKIESASAGVAFKRLIYDGRWVASPTFGQLRAGVENPSKPSAYVLEGKSGQLRIATIESPDKPEGNAYMYLEGMDAWATWDLEHSTDAELPFFILSVEIRGKGRHQVLSRKYKVGPKSRNESLRMVEVSA